MLINMLKVGCLIIAKDSQSDFGMVLDFGLDFVKVTWLGNSMRNRTVLHSPAFIREYYNVKTYSKD